jgi:hypothetical protein
MQTLDKVIWVKFHSYNDKRKIVYFIWQDGIYSVSARHVSINIKPDTARGIYFAVEEKNIGITAASYNR